VLGLCGVARITDVGSDLIFRSAPAATPYAAVPARGRLSVAGGN
jgi:hypothetical protein